MNANKRGVFSRELIGSNVQVKKNEDNRRINMYADYVARGLEVPFHLANNEAELSKYDDNIVESKTVESDNIDPFSELDELE